MILRYIIITISAVCALASGAQTLTATYVQYADSADRYIEAKDWVRAENMIIKALRHEPANKSNFLLWSNLGIVREHMDNHEGAIEAYTIGLATAPKSTVLLTNRARSYLAVNQTKPALEDLNAALSVDSTLQWPRKIRGLLLAQTGNKKEAAKDLKRYTDEFGKDAAVCETLGDLTASDGDIDESLSWYRDAYRQEPDPELIGKMAITAYVFGRIEDVKDDINEAMKQYPRAGTLYLCRALLNKSRYQTGAMESDLKTAKDLGANMEIFDRLTQKSK